jgi:hypothetical protein
MRYGVDTRALRGSADAVQDALWRLERLALADDLSRVGAAFGGGGAASSRSQICLAWKTRLSETRWMLKGLGSRLAAAADSYDVVEAVARQALAAREAPTPSASRAR